MIDGLKILDVFDYKGIQGFLHTDFSVSSIIELPEFTNIDLMNELDYTNYGLKKEEIYNASDSFGKGALMPPVKAMGGSIYQFFTTNVNSIKEELSIIKHSNKSKNVFTSLLDTIVEEEQTKIINKAPLLNKNRNYLVIRTYLSKADEAKCVFQHKKKKYTSRDFVKLYTSALLENDSASEKLKEKFIKFFEPLFIRQISALKNFNSKKISISKPFNLKLEENALTYNLPDILGQVNIIRSYYGLPELLSLDQNKNINLQIFDVELKCGDDRLRINTGKPLYLILDEDEEPIFKIYEDDNGNVVVLNIKTNTPTTHQDSVIFYNTDEYFDTEGLLVMKRKMQNTIEEQLVEKFFLDEGITIKKEKLYKNMQVFNISTLPDTINKLTGELIFQKLYEKIYDKSSKINITMNFNKTPIDEWKSRFFFMKKGWTIIRSIPSVKDFLYETKSVEEKLEALEAASELLRQDAVQFVEAQMFITVISYSEDDLYTDINNVLKSSQFNFGVVTEDKLASTILFTSAAPLAYNKRYMTMDKELILTSKDFINLCSLNNGAGRFSLENPTLVGISNDKKINFINTYDPRMEAPNGIVIGSTGSGKSFTKIFELVKLMLLGERPFISIIDRGGSFINFVKIFGGKAVELNLKDPKNNINPFIYNEEFKEAIFALEEQNRGLEDIVISKEYKDTEGNKIFEADTGRLFNQDEHGNYWPYIGEGVTPQKKLDFFSRIIGSMTKKQKDLAFKTTTMSVIKDILQNNTKTFKAKEVLNKDAILIVDSGFEYDKNMGYDDIKEAILFNPNELMTGHDAEGNLTTETWGFDAAEEGRVVAKNRKIIGKEVPFENAKILAIESTIEYREEMYYFTTQDVQEKLSEKGGYETEVAILNSYVDYNVYGNLFNGPPVLNFDNELLWTIDMGEETPPDLANVILQALNIVLWNSILSPKNKSRKKMVVFDEVHHILSDVEDTGSAYAISYIFRTIRKHGGGIHILSQASPDIWKTGDEMTEAQSSIFAGIKTNAMFKYIIGIDSDDADRTKSDLQLTQTEIEKIVQLSAEKTKVPEKRGVIYVKTKAFKGFINIEATPTIYAIATTKKEEKNLLEAIDKELLENGNVMAFKEEYNLSDSDFKNVTTILKIKIFSTLLPKGINQAYGDNSESIFLNKHINSQAEGSDKYLKGFRDFLLQNNKTFLVNSIIENEITKLKKIF